MTDRPALFVRMRRLCALKMTGGTPVLLGAALLCSLAGVAAAQTAPADLTILQWFESEWDDIERRAPDLFVAGYDGVWLPPPGVASFSSTGYDPFDRFDLGGPPLFDTSSSRARTTFGTMATFDAMVEELHEANTLVYVDGIFNHNSGRTTSDAFLEDGGWPGFWIPRESPPRDKLPTDDWGDFHAGNGSGYMQSENPGGFNYNLHDGDLVALIDIAQETNIQIIRHPVAVGDPDNIPGGLVRNLPDPANAVFYPDLSLTPDVFTNPGTSRNPGAQQFTRHPYNSANPMGGDAVTDNGTGLLMRYAQWMMQARRIDGFRLDAHKHIPSWFWDIFFDTAVHHARQTPGGSFVSPLTFGENVTGNFDILANQTRKDSFANRDALDIQGSAKLRDLLNAGGFGTWNSITSNADSGLIDAADDGFINGSIGMNHVFSHDNGTAGDGGSAPPMPTARQQGLAMQAHVLMRPGRAVIYHNARGVGRSGGFWPRQGAPNALGNDSSSNGLGSAMTTLVQIRNQVGFGEFFPINGNRNDVFVFERAGAGMANCLVALNDRWDAGTISVTVSTSYPQGTRLHEMTGNAANPDVDPTGVIAELLTVGASGVVTLTVPKNTSSTGEHGLGYVIYAQALPTAALSFEGESGVIAPDPANFPDFFQRVTSTPVVDGDSMVLRLETTQTDALDPDVDDNALFRINNGADDWNGNGHPDIPLTASVIGGYEEFTTTHQPLFGSGGAMGLYRQAIDTTGMGEGFHYVSVIAFKKRPSGTTPIFREVRSAVYIDRVGAPMDFVEDGQTFEDTTPELSALGLDRTAERVYLLVDVPGGTDPLTLIGPSSEMNKWDRQEWRKTVGSELSHGTHAITIVGTEPSGNAGITTGTIHINTCPVDLTGDGIVDAGDLSMFITAYLAGDLLVDFTGDGIIDAGDLSAFITMYLAGC